MCVYRCFSAVDFSASDKIGKSVRALCSCWSLILCSNTSRGVSWCEVWLLPLFDCIFWPDLLYPRLKSTIRAIFELASFAESRKFQMLVLPWELWSNLSPLHGWNKCQQAKRSRKDIIQERSRRSFSEGPGVQPELGTARKWYSSYVHYYKHYSILRMHLPQGNCSLECLLYYLKHRDCSWGVWFRQASMDKVMPVGRSWPGLCFIV